MAHAYYIDKENGISYEGWDEIVSVEEYLVNLKKLAASRNWPPRRRLHIVDLRALPSKLKTSDLPVDRIIAFIRRHHRLYKDFKVAVLIRETIETSGILMRILNELPLIILVFTRIDLACLWLGTDEMNANCILQQMQAEFHDQKTLKIITESPAIVKGNSAYSRVDELKVELQHILRNIKDPNTKHEDYMRMVERLGKAWEEFIAETDNNKKMCTDRNG